IKDYIKNEEHFEKFEVEQNSLPTVSMLMLNERFFGQVDNIIKSFLIPIILRKQRSQMNQSSEDDDEEISIGIKEQEQDMQQILFKKNILFKQSISFQHFLSIRTDSHSSHSTIKSPKTVYAELVRLSKKAIDCTIKTDIQYELSNIFKSFIYDIQNKPPKRLKVNVKKSLHKEKEVLLDNTYINVIEDDTSNSVENLSDTKGQKCGKCKQYGHYAKTCQNVI
ncbi:12359_t:CDS:2, partial [Cetraspora pellucida]